MKKSIIISIVLVISLSLYGADNGKIYGVVKSEKTGSPLVGVSVFLENTDYGAYTDKQGFYIINKIPQNKYKIVCEMIGYNKYISH